MKKFLLLSALCCLTVPALASSTDIETKQVQTLVEQKMQLEVSNVKKLSTGFYEVISGRNLFYVDKDVKLVFAGHIIDIDTNRNLTQERLQELLTINPKQLPVKQALKFVAGNGERKLYVFTDPSEQDSQAVEHVLQALNNVTIYKFIVPFGNDMNHIIGRILCAKDPKQAYQEWIFDKVEPTVRENCISKTAEANYYLAKQLGVSKAPTVYFEDGSRYEGLFTKEDIETKFSSLSNQ